MPTKYCILGIVLIVLACSRSTPTPQAEITVDDPEPEEVASLTFIEALPLEVQDQILWSSDYEDEAFKKWEDQGTSHEFAGGGIFNTDVPNIEYGIATEVHNSGTFSSYATIKNVNEPGNKKAVRFMRWTDKAWDEQGNYFPDTAYYSAFFYFPQNYNASKPENNDPFNDGGWWNIFQFKSENNAGSHAIASLDLNNTNGKMHVALLMKDYQDDESEDHIQEFIAQPSPMEIPPREWVHFEVFYKKSKAYDGEIKVWQNGTLIFEKSGVRTILPQGETAVWGLNNYTDYVIGEDGKNEATIYFDDAIVSSERVGAFLK